MKLLLGFATFGTVSVKDVEKIISSASRGQDPIPTWILKQCEDQLLPSTTEIVSLSLRAGKSPKEMKEALVKPLMKKTSNLGFVSKVIERAVGNQLKSYISTNKLDAELQPACRAKCSTETALLKVVSDIRFAVDQNQP